jgi:hypothetical protein
VNIEASRVKLSMICENRKGMKKIEKKSHTKGLEIFLYKDGILVDRILCEKLLHKCLPEINVIVLQ